MTPCWHQHRHMHLSRLLRCFLKLDWGRTFFRNLMLRACFWFILTFVHYLCCGHTAGIIRILRVHQKLFDFLTNISSTALFIDLLHYTRCVFMWRFVVDLRYLWLLKIYDYNILLYTLDWILEYNRQIFIASFQPCLCVAACWQVADLRHTLSAFRIWTFKCFNLLGKLILLLLNDLLLVLWSEFWHAKLSFCIASTIKIFFWE